MRCVFAAAIMLLAVSSSFAGQPAGIRLDPSGISYVYPVFESDSWALTQPDYGKAYVLGDKTRVTHYGDDYYAQDWSRDCGQTYGQRVFAGISGQVVFAGWRGPYGNTVVIFDADTGFALKYSHLSEIDISVGEYVLAGKSSWGESAIRATFNPLDVPKTRAATCIWACSRT